MNGCQGCTDASAQGQPASRPCTRLRQHGVTNCVTQASSVLSTPKEIKFDLMTSCKERSSPRVSVRTRVPGSLKSPGEVAHGRHRLPGWQGHSCTLTGLCPGPGSLCRKRIHLRPTSRPLPKVASFLDRWVRLDFQVGEAEEASPAALLKAALPFSVQSLKETV